MKKHVTNGPKRLGKASECCDRFVGCSSSLAPCRYDERRYQATTDWTLHSPAGQHLALGYDPGHRSNTDVKKSHRMASSIYDWGITWVLYGYMIIMSYPISIPGMHPQGCLPWKTCSTPELHLHTVHVSRGATRSPPRGAMRQIEDDKLAAVTGRISSPPGVPRATASAHPKLAQRLWPSNAHKQHVNPQIHWSLICGHRRNPRCLAQQKCRQPAKQLFQPNFGRQNDSGLGASRYSACKCQWAASYLRAEVTHRNRFQNHAPKAAWELWVLAAHPNMPRKRRLQSFDTDLLHNNFATFQTEATQLSLRWVSSQLQQICWHWHWRFASNRSPPCQNFVPHPQAAWSHHLSSTSALLWWPNVPLSAVSWRRQGQQEKCHTFSVLITVTLMRFYHE